MVGFLGHSRPSIFGPFCLDWRDAVQAHCTRDTCAAVNTNRCALVAATLVAIWLIAALVRGQEIEKPPGLLDRAKSAFKRSPSPTAPARTKSPPQTRPAPSPNQSAGANQKAGWFKR